MEEESESHPHPPQRSPRSPPPRPQALPRRTLEEAQLSKFNQLKTLAYNATTFAMNLDEEGKKNEAFKAYQDALVQIDKTVQVAHCGGFPPEEVEKVDGLVFKMRMTRKEILERVSDLQHGPATTSATSGPTSPSYLDGPLGSAGNLPSAGSSSSTRNPPPYSAIATPGSSAGQVQSPGNLYQDLSGTLEEIALEHIEQATLRSPLPLTF